MGSLGSAAWAEWVVDGDIGHEIDAREIPANWKTGYRPRCVETPSPTSSLRDVPDEGEVYHLNPALVDWAFQAYQERPASVDNDNHAPAPLSSSKAPYARRPPFVLKGDTLLIQHFLARQAARPMGQRLGEVLHGWKRQLRYVRLWRTPALCNRSLF